MEGQKRCYCLIHPSFSMLDGAYAVCQPPSGGLGVGRLGVGSLSRDPTAAWGSFQSTVGRGHALGVLQCPLSA